MNSIADMLRELADEMEKEKGTFTIFAQLARLRTIELYLLADLMREIAVSNPMP